MRILLVSQHCAGVAEPVAEALAQIPDNTLFFATQNQKYAPATLAGRRILLKKPDAAKFGKDYLGYFSLAIKTAQAARVAWQAILKNSLAPDMVLNCSSNGMALGIGEIFPRAFCVEYKDLKLANLAWRDGALFRARKDVQAVQAAHSALTFGANGLPTPLCVDTDFYRPAPRPGAGIIFCGGALAEAEVAKIWERARYCLSSLPDIPVFVLMENSLNGFPWQEKAEELASGLRKRLFLCPPPSRSLWKRILWEASRLVVPQPDPPVRARVLEAMSAGVCVFSSCAADFFVPGENMAALAENAGPEQTVQTVATLPARDAARLAAAARKTVLASFARSDIMPEHLALLLERYAAWGG